MTGVRRGNGEGSIRKRGAEGKEYYEGRIQLLDGTRQSVYGKTRRDVQNKLREIQNLLVQGRTIGTGDQVVEDYLYGWLDTVVRLHTSPTTVEAYEKRIRWIARYIGKTRLSRLKPAHIDAAYRAMLDSGLSTRTVYAIHSTMKQAFALAVARDQIVASPFAQVKTPRVDAPEMQTLTAAELRHLFAQTERDEWYPMWVLLGTTGIRLGEALALRWSLVTGTTIRIMRSLHPERGKGMVLCPVKNKSSNRTLDITPFCSAALAAHRATQTVRPVKKELDFLFRHDDGTPYRHEKVRLAFCRALRKAGLPQIRVHDLRHTYATLMLEQSIPVHKVAQALGHSNPNITSAVYSHVTKKMDSDALSAMEAILAL